MYGFPQMSYVATAPINEQGPTPTISDTRTPTISNIRTPTISDTRTGTHLEKDTFSHSNDRRSRETET